MRGWKLFAYDTIEEAGWSGEVDKSVFCLTRKAYTESRPGFEYRLWFMGVAALLVYKWRGRMSLCFDLFFTRMNAGPWPRLNHGIRLQAQYDWNEK